MRWPWRREPRGASAATLAAQARAEVAQRRAQAAAEQTGEIDRRAAELAQALPPGALVERVARVFFPGDD
jgi:hypothetical protein